ncbi:hypothetical protein [Neolewinella aurantiaca]|uniref:hypothetical protein n=1 Tax=Neolewinella aurantiaca TaxID=2602767 RepID=UPI0011C79FAF|nr:hypothetical protein [Neolewinella aurantiaca]
MKSLCFALAVSLLFISAKMPVDRPATVKYTGEEIFTSILMLSGPVTGKIPELRMLKRQFKSKQDRKAMSREGALAASMVKYIKAKSPEFFPRFASAMQSGDRRQVESALKSMGIPVADYLQAQKELPRSITDSRQFQSMVRGVSGHLRSKEKELLIKGKAYNTPLMEYTLAQYLNDNKEEMLEGHSMPGNPIPFPPLEKIPPPSSPGEWPAMDDLDPTNPFPMIDVGGDIVINNATMINSRENSVSVVVDTEVAAVSHVVGVVVLLVVVLAIDITPFSTNDQAGRLFQESLVNNLARTLEA